MTAAAERMERLEAGLAELREVVGDLTRGLELAGLASGMPMIGAALREHPHLKVMSDKIDSLFDCMELACEAAGVPVDRYGRNDRRRAGRRLQVVKP